MSLIKVFFHTQILPIIGMGPGPGPGGPIMCMGGPPGAGPCIGPGGPTGPPGGPPGFGGPPVQKNAHFKYWYFHTLRYSEENMRRFEQLCILKLLELFLMDLSKLVD